MPTILTQHKVEPLLGGPHYANGRGIYATILVNQAGQQNAMQMTKDFLIVRRWYSLGCCEVFGPILREQVQHDASLLAIYDQAQREGIGGEFTEDEGGAPVFD